MLLAEITVEQLTALLTPLAVIIVGIINLLAAIRAASNAKDAGKQTAALNQNAIINQAKTEHKLDVAVSKAAEVKSDLQENRSHVAAQLEQIKATGEITHALVNDRMSSTLKTLAQISRRLADVTKAPEDVKAAEAAEAASQSHEQKESLAK